MQAPRKHYDCLLLDLDGTLADTAPDMLAALNHVLSNESAPPLPMSRVRDQVSNGTNALLKLAFGVAQPSDDFARRREQFLTYYRTHLCVATRLFPGMDETLQYLESQGKTWGIVTNKPGWLTDPLMEHLQLQQRAACVVSADTTAQRKPHPLPMYTAAQQARTTPENCIYVGDAQRDIQAGKAAGMRTIVATWGYIDETQQPETWGADDYAERPRQLLQWFSPASDPPLL